MSNRKRHDYSGSLISAALLVTVVRYAGAFIASDLGIIEGRVSEYLSALMGLTGIGMGILDVLGTAYLFDGWRKAMPAMGRRWSMRFKVLTLFVVCLLVVGLGILVPFTVSRIRHGSMQSILGNWDWLWSILVNVAPYLLIGGIAVGQTQAFHIAPDASHDASIQAHIKASPIYQCTQCDASFDSSPRLAAHTRWKHSGNGYKRERIIDNVEARHVRE